MMSSNCEDSSVNMIGIRGIPEKCDCGRNCLNIKLQLFICVQDHLYKWVDEAVYEEVHDALPKAECFASDLMKIKMEIESIKIVDEELKEDVRKLKKQNVIMKVGFLMVFLSIVIKKNCVDHV
ncbi:hypothetical protein Bca4012_024641 [Brassica carinata]